MNHLGLVFSLGASVQRYLEKSSSTYRFYEFIEVESYGERRVNVFGELQ